jgi:hypothetical protein
VAQAIVAGSIHQFTVYSVEVPDQEDHVKGLLVVLFGASSTVERIEPSIDMSCLLTVANTQRDPSIHKCLVYCE